MFARSFWHKCIVWVPFFAFMIFGGIWLNERGKAGLWPMEHAAPARSSVR